MIFWFVCLFKMNYIWCAKSNACTLRNARCLLPGTLKSQSTMGFAAPRHQKNTCKVITGLAVGYSSCFISVLYLNLYVCCFDAEMSRNPSRGPKNLYIYEPQQNLGRGLRSLKTGLSTPHHHHHHHHHHPHPQRRPR